MSTIPGKMMRTIGARLKEERARLGINQKMMAEIGGVTPKTQGIYEKDDRMPDADYLSRAYGAGVDVQYVVTGVKAKPITPLFDEEGKKIELGDRTSEDYVAAIFLVLSAADDLGLRLNRDQVQILADYALHEGCNRDDLKAWIKTTYAMAGVKIPGENSVSND
jgi:transcriptional regulator with XRE-family HTH domain